MFRAAHKQWEVAILILINTSASIKFRIVEMDNWLNLNKHRCWDSIRDPFEANPWTAGLSILLTLRLHRGGGEGVKKYVPKEEGREGGEKKCTQCACWGQGSNPGPTLC